MSPLGVATGRHARAVLSGSHDDHPDERALLHTAHQCGLVSGE